MRVRFPLTGGAVAGGIPEIAAAQKAPALRM
jgi:hypothetical protein